MLPVAIVKLLSRKNHKASIPLRIIIPIPYEIHAYYATKTRYYKSADLKLISSHYHGKNVNANAFPALSKNNFEKFKMY